MNKLGTFNQFLTSQSVQIPLLEFAVNLVLTGIFGVLIGLLYVRYANTISNRKNFANNIIMLSVITMVVISIVKSSLALSLGLVGALSIVRFRTAIKEPEELSYLFFAIAVGLGMGADQFTIVLVSFILIALLIYIRYRFRLNKTSDSSLYLTITSSQTKDLTLSRVTDILVEQCDNVNLKRINKTSDSISLVFHAKFADPSAIEKLGTALETIDSNVKLSIIDNNGIIA